MSGKRADAAVVAALTHAEIRIEGVRNSDMDDEKEVVSAHEARKAVQDMSRRVALLHMCYARTLADELGEQRAGDLIEKAIGEYGTKIGERIRKRVEAMGLPPTLENFGRGSDLSPIGFNRSRAVVDGEPRWQSFGCVLAEVWGEYGEEELGGRYCLVDPAKMQGYDPGWTMVHTKKIPDGCEYCEIAVRRAAKNENARTAGGELNEFRSQVPI